MRRYPLASQECSSHRPHQSKKQGLPQGKPLSFWSKCGDSNSRPPVPEVIFSSVLTTFVYFLVLFSPELVLFCAIIDTVSVQKNSVDGQRCGRWANPTKQGARKLNRVYPRVEFYLLPLVYHTFRD